MKMFELFESAPNKNVLNAALSAYDSKSGSKALSPEGMAEFRRAIQFAKDKLVSEINADPELKKNWPIFRKWYDAEGSKYLQVNEKALFAGNSIKIGSTGSQASVDSSGKDPTLTVPPAL